MGLWDRCEVCRYSIIMKPDNPLVPPIVSCGVCHMEMDDGDECPLEDRELLKSMPINMDEALNCLRATIDSAATDCCQGCRFWKLCYIPANISDAFARRRDGLKKILSELEDTMREMYLFKQPGALEDEVYVIIAKDLDDAAQKVAERFGYTNIPFIKNELKLLDTDNSKVVKVADVPYND